MGTFEQTLGNWLVNDYAGMLRKHRRTVTDWTAYAAILRAWSAGVVSSTAARQALRRLYEAEP